MIADDVMLPCFAGAELFIFSVVSTAYFPFTSAHGGDGIGILDKQIRDHVVGQRPFPATGMQEHAYSQLFVIVGADGLVWMLGFAITHNILALEGAQRFLAKDVRLAAFHMDDTVTARLKPRQLLREVLLDTNARDRHVAAEEKAFRGERLIGPELEKMLSARSTDSKFVRIFCNVIALKRVAT